MAPFRKRKKKKKLKKFIDFDKYKEIFYDNLYIDDYKIVVKTPLTKRNNLFDKKIKISKFDLERYTYLLSYD